MSFIKTTCGKACKVAVVLRAEWKQGFNTTVKEAFAPDETVVAYYDEKGWFVAAAYADMNTDGVFA